jgi:hypothetical protein
MQIIFNPYKCWPFEIYIKIKKWHTFLYYFNMLNREASFIRVFITDIVYFY